HWIPKGHPGAGNILVFNNGLRRTGGAYSSVDEFVPPVDGKGQYKYTAGEPYGPDAPVWSYSPPKRTDFYSSFISGAHRLPNGDGPGGATPAGPPGHIVPAGMRARLKLTDAQQKQVAALQTEAEGKLDKVLDEGQRKLFKGMRDKGAGPANPPGPPGPPGGG